MAEFTKEQLISRAKENINSLTRARDNFVGDKELVDIHIRLAEIALAELTAEPVGEFYHEKRWVWYQISEGDKVPEDRHIPLYRLPLLEGLK